MRLRTEIWVMAHVRRAYAEGAMATVLRKGDPDAGAVFVRTLRPDGAVALYGPAPAPAGEDATQRFWRALVAEGAAQPADERLAREAGFDPDIWVIEIEDRHGRHFLDDRLVSG